MTVKQSYVKADGGDFPVLEDGAYLAILESAENGEVTDYNDPAITHPAIKFRYAVETEDGGKAMIFRDCRCVISAGGNPSNLYRDLKGMVGATVDELLEKHADTGRLDEELNKLVNSLVGQEFLVSVTQKTSQAGRQYSKFLSVSRQKGVQVKGKPEVDIDTDKIPF